MLLIKQLMLVATAAAAVVAAVNVADAVVVGAVNDADADANV